MRNVKAAWRLLKVLACTFACLWAAATRFQKADERLKGQMLRTYSQRVLAAAGVTTRFEGNVAESVHLYGMTDNPPGAIVVSNHVSWIDIFSLNSAAPSRFIAKAEIAHWPLFGQIAKLIGTLFINRSSRRAILKINDDIMGVLCQSEVVALFAEGTTTFGNELLPLRSNFLAPATAVGAQVQPVILSYTQNGQPTKKVAFAGEVTLFGSLWNVVREDGLAVTAYFLEPVDAKGLTRHEVGRRCEERMRTKLKQIWGAAYVDSDPNASALLAEAIAKG